MASEPNEKRVLQSASNEDSQNESAPVAFSWLHPHTIFVVILVGPDEVPFSLQKDLLCAKSKHFADHFAAATPGDDSDTLEHVIKMPDTAATVFGLAQNYMYTREVWPDDGSLPSYEDLFDLWRLGGKYGIYGLCNKTLECMEEVKERTRQIPGTVMISKVWEETTDDSGAPVRRLLLQWAEEYFKSSNSPSDFARTLPQEFLSELVVEMSAITDVARATVPVAAAKVAKSSGGATGGAAGTSGTTKSARALEGTETPVPSKRARASNTAAASGRASGASTAPAKKAAPKRKASSAFGPPRVFTEAQKLYYCADLLTRMLSGPGYWTRMVKPFRHPVDPVADGVPDYLEKIAQPMDLLRVKANMDGGLYTTPEQFAEDVRLIVRNCQTYWSPGTPLYADSQKFSKAFEEKFADMNKWLAKMLPDDGA